MNNSDFFSHFKFSLIKPTISPYRNPFNAATGVK